MRIQGFSKDRAREALDTWRRDGELVELNEEYTLIRATIKDLYCSANFLKSILRGSFIDFKLEAKEIRK